MPSFKQKMPTTAIADAAVLITAIGMILRPARAINTDDIVPKLKNGQFMRSIGESAALGNSPHVSLISSEYLPPTPISLESDYLPPLTAATTKPQQATTMKIHVTLQTKNILSRILELDNRPQLSSSSVAWTLALHYLPPSRDVSALELNYVPPSSSPPPINTEHDSIKLDGLHTDLSPPSILSTIPSSSPIYASMILSSQDRVTGKTDRKHPIQVDAVTKTSDLTSHRYEPHTISTQNTMSHTDMSTSTVNTFTMTIDQVQPSISTPDPQWIFATPPVYTAIPDSAREDPPLQVSEPTTTTTGVSPENTQNSIIKSCGLNKQREDTYSAPLTTEIGSTGTHASVHPSVHLSNDPHSQCEKTIPTREKMTRADGITTVDIPATFQNPQINWNPTSPVIAVLFTELDREGGFCDRLCRPSQQTTTRKAPPKCPPLDKVNSTSTEQQQKKCSDECSELRPCVDDNQMCCNNGCAHVCMTQRTIVSCADLECGLNHVCINRRGENARCIKTQPNPGRCPLDTGTGTSPNTTQNSEHCTDECHFDSDCGNVDKCCYSGCNLRCVPTDRRRTCDQIQCANVGQQICIDHPTRDAKCVSVLQREGACPTADDRIASKSDDCRLTECRLDDECGGNEKCCFDGCDRRCVQPIIRKKCENINCSVQEICIDHPTADARCISIVERPGECPSVDNETVSDDIKCDDTCQVDEQCPPQLKCCSHGCSVHCTPAIHRITCRDITCRDQETCVDYPGKDGRCVSNKPKPGRCPGLDDKVFTRTESCQKNCTLDNECVDGQKCCTKGCSRVCLVADTRKRCEDIVCDPTKRCIEDVTNDAYCVSVTPKKGQCPIIRKTIDTDRSCNRTCRYDSQCEGKNKCCSNGCALQCMEPRPNCETIQCKVGYKCQLRFDGEPECKPIPCQQDGEVVDIECNSCTCIQGFLLCSQEDCPPVKPGFCPRLVRGYRGLCSENCSSDYECPGDEKCCNTGCGHSCKSPDPQIVHPCKTIRFRCGRETRCAATRGLCQPGKPCPLVPLCVSRKAPFCESCPEGKVCILQKRPCPQGHCQRQPICVQLYSDDTPFEENEQIEKEVVAKQQQSSINDL